MNLNLNVRNYINAISQSPDKNPIEELKNNSSKFERILSGIEKDMSQLVGSFTPKHPLDELVNSILKLDTIIRTCSCIEDAVGGSAAFENLYPILQKAIVDSGMKDKLSIFQSGNPKAIEEEKKKILEQYKETNFPTMVKQVKDEDVSFLLQTFGVLKIAPDAPAEVLS